MRIRDERVTVIAPSGAKVGSTFRSIQIQATPAIGVDVLKGKRIQMYKVFFVTCIAGAMSFSVTHADVVDSFEIGSGASTSTFLFQFTNGNQYLYEVSYDEPMSGQDVVEFIMNEQAGYFVADIVSYSFGDVLNGLGIGDDFDEGFGTPPDYLDYWHYWTKDDVVDEWESSFVGFGDRTVTDGSWDGWVFNSNDAPVPAGASLITLSCLATTRRRRR